MVVEIALSLTSEKHATNGEDTYTFRDITSSWESEDYCEFLQDLLCQRIL